MPWIRLVLIDSVLIHYITMILVTVLKMVGYSIFIPQTGSIYIVTIKNFENFLENKGAKYSDNYRKLAKDYYLYVLSKKHWYKSRFIRYN